MTWVGGELGFDFFDTTGVSPAFKLGSEPNVHNLQGECFVDWSGPDRNAIGIIVEFSHLGGPLIPAQAAAYTFYLICNNGFTITAASEYDATVGTTFCDRYGRRANEVRVVAGGIGMTAAVDDAVTLFFQEFNNGGFEWKARMVGSDGNF